MIKSEAYLKMREVIQNPEKREKLSLESEGNRICVFNNHKNGGLFSWANVKDK